MVEEYRVPAPTVLSRLMAAKSGNIVQGAGKHILIACMPKSASTYLTALIAAYPEIKEVVLTYGHHRREQELDPTECAIFHGLNYVAQAHVRYSLATQQILTRYSIVPVILVRNIPDCVVSMRDHLLQEDLDIPQAYVPRNFRTLTPEQQFDFIIDQIVPWYASFFASWSEYEGPALAVTYRQLVADFPAAMTEILRGVGFDPSPNEIQAVMAKVNPRDKRYNIGRLGRSREHLTDNQIERIRRHFAWFADVPGMTDMFDYGEPQVFTGRFRPGRTPAQPVTPPPPETFITK